jgi:hypothetical protein
VEVLLQVYPQELVFPLRELQLALLAWQELVARAWELELVQLLVVREQASQRPVELVQSV